MPNPKRAERAPAMGPIMGRDGHHGRRLVRERLTYTEARAIPAEAPLRLAPTHGRIGLRREYAASRPLPRGS